jgi:TonB family protein
MGMMTRILLGTAALAALSLAMAQQASIGISDNVSKPTKLVKMVKPAYPAEAKAAGIQGAVKLELVVGKDGRVQSARTLSGPPELAGAATDAVKQWEYQPAVQNGEPVEFMVQVDVNFALGGDPPTHVKGSDQQQKLVKQPRPVYPPEAKAAGIQGRVRLRATIAKDGTVKALETLEGEPVLVTAAVEAVKQWEYKPTEVDGRPVEVITDIDVNFTLAK